MEQRQVQRIEELLREIEATADAEARDRMVELVRLLMDFHGAGLERMTEIVVAAGLQGRAVLDGFVRDEMVSHLLLLYGLHPEDVETRVRAALEKVRPYLRTHGGGAQLLAVEGGVVRLSLEGSCNGCPSSAATLKQAIEIAIYEAAPDVTEVVADSPVGQAAASVLVQIGR